MNNQVSPIVTLEALKREIKDVKRILDTLPPEIKSQSEFVLLVNYLEQSIFQAERLFSHLTGKEN